MNDIMDELMKTEAHDLMPESLVQQIPILGSTQEQDDPVVWMKYFTPDSSWTWYVIEFDRVDRLCFGLVIGHEIELGYFSLAELESVTGPLGLRVERDLHFRQQLLSMVRPLHQ